MTAAFEKDELYKKLFQYLLFQKILPHIKKHFWSGSKWLIMEEHEALLQGATIATNSFSFSKKINEEIKKNIALFFEEDQINPVFLQKINAIIEKSQVKMNCSVYLFNQFLGLTKISPLKLLENSLVYDFTHTNIQTHNVFFRVSKLLKSNKTPTTIGLLRDYLLANTDNTKNSTLNNPSIGFVVIYNWNTYSEHISDLISDNLITSIINNPIFFTSNKQVFLNTMNFLADVKHIYPNTLLSEYEQLKNNCDLNDPIQKEALNNIYELSNHISTQVTQCYALNITHNHQFFYFTMQRNGLTKSQCYFIHSFFKEVIEGFLEKNNVFPEYIMKEDEFSYLHIYNFSDQMSCDLFKNKIQIFIETINETKSLLSNKNMIDILKTQGKMDMGAFLEGVLVKTFNHKILTQATQQPNSMKKLKAGMNTTVKI